MTTSPGGKKKNWTDSERQERIGQHTMVVDLDGKRVRVSAMAGHQCYACHKTDYEITEAVHGDICDPKNAMRSYEPSHG